MSFSDDINKFVKKTNDKNLKVFKGTVLDMFGRIVKRTPVGTPSLWQSNPPPDYVGGSLRANWQMEINKSPQGTISGVEPPSSMKVNGLKIGDTAYITNNLPYAEPVEHGWSSQRPEGMVKVTVNEFKNIVNKEAKK